MKQNPLKNAQAHDWVLATRTDGRALGIGERGPLWLVFDPLGERPGDLRLRHVFGDMFLVFVSARVALRNLSTTLRHSPLQFTVQDLLSLDWVG